MNNLNNYLYEIQKRKKSKRKSKTMKAIGNIAGAALDIASTYYNIKSLYKTIDDSKLKFRNTYMNYRNDCKRKYNTGNDYRFLSLCLLRAEIHAYVAQIDYLTSQTYLCFGNADCKRILNTEIERLENKKRDAREQLERRL
jgi:hypothetical protein